MDLFDYFRLAVLRSLWSSLVAVAIVTSFSGPVSAQAPDTSNWNCSRCPFKSGYEASYSGGASYVSDDAAHFGDATGYDQQGVYLNLDGEGSYIEDGYRSSWFIEDLGLDSRVLQLDGGRQGTYDYYVGFSQLPRRVFDTTQTVFSATADDTLILSDDWVRAGLTSGFTALEANLFDQNIGSDRATLQIGGRYIPTDRFDVFADYRQSRRDGLAIQGGAYFTNSSLLPRPFDYQTDELDVGVRYGGDRSTVKLAYYGSFFDDKNPALNWKNPFTSVDGGEFGAFAQPPDSSFQQLLLSGSYRTGWYDTIVTYSAATGVMEQDDPLLAYTTNPNISTAPLPAFSLDGQVDTTNLALTVTAKPHQRVRLKAAYRYDDRGNQTPVQQWNRVIVDSFNSGEFESNMPYSFERTRLNLDAQFDVRRNLRLSAGYDYRELHRDFQEVAEQDEVSGWGQLSWQPNAYIDLRGRAGTSKRDVDRYDTGVAGSLGQNPLLRKFNLAYRYREFGEFTIGASLPERPISVSGTVLFANDSYTESQLGLLASDEFRVAADLSWALSPLSSVYLTAAIDEIDSEQAGSEFFQTPDWDATHSDEFVTFGGGYRVEELKERFDLEIDYTHGVGSSEIAIRSASGGTGRFPDLKSTLDSLRVRLLYRASERLEGNLELRYESFAADDWALQGVGPATVPQLLSLGADPYDYDVFLIGLGVRYSF
jgi:MtrB/PioB family decaheme-associated outer membrane protein